MRRRLSTLVTPFVLGALLLAPSASASIRFVTQWGSQGSGDGQFMRPFGVATDSADNVYVIEYNGARVDKFTSSGTFITSWGSAGSGAGQFTHARDIAVGESDNVYVADRGNNRIEEFSSSGSFIRQWGTRGSGEGELHAPYGVDTDSAGNVYVADLGNYRIEKFDSSGNFLAQHLAGFPTDIALDSVGNYYSTDYQIFAEGGVNGEFDYVDKADPSGNPLAHWEIGSRVVSLATDSSDNLLVAEPDGDVVLEFDASGHSVGRWGSEGSKIGQFHSPSGVAVSSGGDVYVADANNNRIQMFRESTQLPDTTIVSGPTGTVHDSTPTFRFSSADLDAKFSCKLDSAAYLRCGSPWTTPPLTNGVHTLRVRATDQNGADATPALRSFTVKATHPTDVGVSGSTLVVTAGPLTSNNIRIGRRNGSTLRVSDEPANRLDPPGRYSGSVVRAGEHCTRSGTSSVDCTGMVARIRVWARDQTDKVTNATVIPSSQWGGAGRDVLLAGQGDDTLTGGPEPDFLSAGGGNDLILARDDADDNVVCGGGDRDKAQLDPLPLDDRVSDCETKARH